MRHASSIREFRTLTIKERELLTWMLEHGKPEAKQYIKQIDTLRVVGHCACGCPTIDLGTENQRKPKEGISKIIADAEGQSPEGVPVGVIVHERNNQIAALEIYSIDGRAVSLPDVAALKSYDEMDT